jgi:hypothetical protein
MAFLDYFKDWIVDLFVNQILSPEKRWAIIRTLLDALKKSAEATETLLDDAAVALLQLGVADPEYRELIDAIVDRIFQDAKVSGDGKVRASALCADSELIAHCTTVATKLNERTAGRFNIDWQKVLEIVMLFLKMFVLDEGDQQPSE